MKLRVGVVGCGPMGAGHVKHYRGLPGCELVAVSDLDPARRAEAALRSGAMAFADPRELIGRVDAVSIATPTGTHRELAVTFLEAGVHALVEKPMAPSVPDALAMIEAATRRGAVLQIGHIERFNPAFLAAKAVVNDPRYVICDRLSPFAFRSTDIGVILDLMIHDLDILLEFLPGEVVSLEAFGLPVISDQEDMCDARLRFADGAIADLRASRVSMKRMRKIRMFQRDAYLSIDYGANSITTFKKSAAYERGDLDPMTMRLQDMEDPFGVVFGQLLDVHESALSSSDALRDELASFLGACRGEHPPEVTGADGLRAIALAERIQASTQAYLETEAKRAGIDLPDRLRKPPTEAPTGLDPGPRGRTERYDPLDESEL